MTSIKTESVVCTLCGDRHASPVAAGTDREYYSSGDTFSIVKCDGCGLIRLDPRPTAEELGRIYPETYHSYVLDEAEGSKGSIITRMRQRAGANRFRPVLNHFPKDATLDVLDVGCGNGWQMELFKSLAPERIRTFGVEISKPVCDFARSRGHTVYHGRFEDVELDRQFDIVNLTHVIEHVSDPRQSVRKAFEALRPGGALVLETPNIGSYEWSWFRHGNWGAYHIPRHWYFFDRETLKKLGQSESFDLIAWHCHPAPTHWVWTMHNVAYEGRGPVARLGAKMFDPVKIFRGGLVPTLAMAAFYMLDAAVLAFGGKTSVMTGIFRKMPGAETRGGAGQNIEEATVA